MRFFRNSRGLTLTELMVALTVMGIMAAFAVPNLARYNANRKLRQATAEIEVAVRRARSSATTQQAATRVSVNAAAGLLLVQRDSNRDGVFETTLINKTLPKGVDVEDSDFGGEDAFIFNTRGVPSAGGSIRVVGARGNKLEVRVAAGSGSISVIEPAESEDP